MKARTCPHCNYKYSLSEYFRKPFFMPTFGEFNCNNCGKKIIISARRRLLIAVIMGLCFFILALAMRNIEPGTKFWVLYAIVAIVGVSFLFTFDKFKKAE